MPPAQCIARMCWRFPTIWLLHENFSQFQDEVGDLAPAVGEQQRVCDLLPCFAAPQDKTGLLLVREGKTAEATACFSRALALDSRLCSSHE